MTFDDTKTVITPEQVSVTYTLAGLGTRFGAVLVDTFIEVALAAILLALILLSFAVPFERVGTLGERVPGWLVAMLLLALFGVMWGYFIFWETIWNGQTPGKRMAGIRVMRDLGYPVDFRAAFVRNIVRYVDFLPMFYGVGALAVFISKDAKRLGDYAAGTIVVIDSQPAPAAKAAPVAAPAYQSLGDPSLLNLRAITREQFAVLERFLARREELPPATRAELAGKIALALLPVIGMAPSLDPAYPYEILLAELAAAYRSLAET